ncbi:hypothetical protein Hanom_Chr08g00706691 [Helianthus anomalus]
MKHRLSSNMKFRWLLIVQMKKKRLTTVEGVEDYRLLFARYRRKEDI